MTKDNTETLNDSRDSLVKKGALAATAVALGAGATAGTASAQEDGEVVVPGDDYHPDLDFEVTSQLDEGSKNDLLETAGLDAEFSDPDDWDVYVINYDMGGSAQALGYLMTEDLDIEAGDSGTMDEDATIRNSELNLMEFTP
ncbi:MULTISPECIES: calcium-binding protein [Natrialbaceae]|uniref:calcium-binding protein n=1 Tax=Natrialbaceae TaxID=1644061 RepID=UPI00207CFE98|nr:calcium-binding protein [Natronococcus sp. CG52]